MPISPICRDPEMLCPCVHRLHTEMVDMATAREICPVTIETIRELDRQQHYVGLGVSWTLKSYHLAQPPHDLSLAFDLAPQEYLSHPLWNPDGEKWDQLGDLGQLIGLEWGFQLWRKDKPHFQLTMCECTR